MQLLPDFLVTGATPVRLRKAAFDQLEDAQALSRRSVVHQSWQQHECDPGHAADPVHNGQHMNRSRNRHAIHLEHP